MLLIRHSLVARFIAWLNPAKIGHSLPKRAWSAIIFISLVTIISSLASYSLSKVSTHDAQAINQAGSVRMATYRINHALVTQDINLSTAYLDDLVADMHDRLDNLLNYQNKTSNSHDNIDATLDNIYAQWQYTLLPLLYKHDTQEFYEQSLIFIDKVNSLVTAIQIRNEQRQLWQQYIQIISLSLIIAIMIVGMWELNRSALIPLKNLTDTARQFRQGKPLDLQANNMHIRGYQELNELSDAFLQMLRTIDNHQQELKNEVKQKTQHLTQSNQALYKLYTFAQHIATHHLNTEELHVLIKDFAKLLPDSEISLCIHDEFYSNNIAIAVSQKSRHDFCMADDCAECELKADATTRIIPIESPNAHWGELLIREPHRNTSSVIHMVNADEFSQEDLLLTLANLIALAFVSNQRQKQTQELILSEERNTLARELHDSIAQSLSYLKIQASLLSKLAEQEKDILTPRIPNDIEHKLIDIHARQDKVREDIKDGLNHTYSQLRELLSTFRLKIEGGDFDHAMQQTVREFAHKGGFDYIFDNQVLTSHLSANEQIHLLQITREALSNIHRHAQASHANIVLYQDSTNYDVILRISDDGIGIRQADKNKSNHYGLSTMSERALALGGTLTTESIYTKGTEVVLRFLPQFFLHQLKYPQSKTRSNKSHSHHQYPDQ